MAEELTSSRPRSLFGVAELFRVLTQNRAMTAAAMRGVRFLSASGPRPLLPLLFQTRIQGLQGMSSQHSGDGGA
jgi:hypothetical protein